MAIEGTKAQKSTNTATEKPPVKQPTQPPAKLELGSDTFKGEKGSAQTEDERQKGAVQAVKAALQEYGAVVGPDARAQAMEKVGNAVLTGARAAAGAPGSKGFFERFKDFGRGLVRELLSDHPLASIGRAGLRMVPILGFLVGAADLRDAHKTLQDPAASFGQKALAAVKGGAGLAAIGAGGLLVATGATAFLPFLVGAGAIAAGADVTLSRLRTGHW